MPDHIDPSVRVAMHGGQAVPKPTLRKSYTALAWCEHCQAKTLQMRGPRLPSGGQGSCLQCIADGGTCCTLRQYSRWVSYS